jgi:hypothetical protein
MEYRTLAEKYRPEVKDTKTLMKDGQRVTVNIFKDGTQEVVPFAPDQEKAHFADTGNAVLALDPFTGRPVGNAIAKSVTPDAILSDARARAGQQQADRHFQATQDQGKVPAGYMANPNGQGLTFIPGGPADPRAGKATDGERLASGFLDRMTNAEKVMGPIEKTSGKPGLRESIAASMGPMGETAANAMPEFMGGRSPERQQYRQAQEDWVRAKLRKESGAVIANDEMDREIRTYFPQVGDASAVVAQKAKARQIAANAMRTSAGPVAAPNVDDLLKKYGASR